MNHFIEILTAEESNRINIYDVNNIVLNIEERLTEVLTKLRGFPNDKKADSCEGALVKKLEVLTETGFFADIENSIVQTNEAIENVNNNTVRVLRLVKELQRTFESPMEVAMQAGQITGNSVSRY